MKRLIPVLAVAVIFLAASGVQWFVENRNQTPVTFQIRITPQVNAQQNAVEIPSLKTVPLPEPPLKTKRNKSATKSIGEIYQVASAYVVQIIIQFEDPKGNPLNPNFPYVEGAASGSVIQVGTTSYVLTANHAIPRYQNIQNLRFFAQFSNRQRQEIEVVGYNKTPLDAAVFKFKDSNFQTKAVAKIGDSRLLAIGDPVLAIGSPYGVFNFLANGVVGIIDLQSVSNYFGPGLIGSNVHISPGNSGGPLLNYDGEIVGVNEGNYSGNPFISGSAPPVSLSIPMHDIETILPDLLKGEVKIGWLEYHVQNSWDLPQYIRDTLNLGEDSPKGPLVIADASGISQNAPLGMLFTFITRRLRPGDLIIKYAGNPVKSLSEILRINLQLRPGDRVEVVALRNKKEVRKEIALIEFPPDTTESNSPTAEIPSGVFKISPK